MPWTESARRQYARTATRYTTDLTDAESALEGFAALGQLLAMHRPDRYAPSIYRVAE